jgi:hypothetical protein
LWSELKKKKKRLQEDDGGGLWQWPWAERRWWVFSRAGSMYFGALGKTSKWGLKKKFK